MGKSQKQSAQDGKYLLRIHRQHLGLYKRVADMLGVSAGYVSLVANGKRESEAILMCLLEELRSIR